MQFNHLHLSLVYSTPFDATFLPHQYTVINFWDKSTVCYVCVSVLAMWYRLVVFCFVFSFCCCFAWYWLVVLLTIYYIMWCYPNNKNFFFALIFLLLYIMFLDERLPWKETLFMWWFLFVSVLVGFTTHQPSIGHTAPIIHRQTCHRQKVRVVWKSCW